MIASRVRSATADASGLTRLQHIFVVIAWALVRAAEFSCHPNYDAQFRARVSGITEGGHAFEEETVVRDLALQGAMISLAHCPRLQSELQVTMETAGANGTKTMKLRGYVVRIDADEKKGHSSVGVVFTD